MVILKSLYPSVRGYLRRYIREGRRFKNKLDLIRNLDNESEEYRRYFQLKSLKKIVLHAYKNVPFWKKRFDDYGINPYSVSSVEVLQKLPLLTKQDVLANFSNLLSSKSLKVFLAKGITSGTTGSPGVFYRDINSITFEHALLWHLREKAGIKKGCGLLWLRGDIIVPSSQRTPPFWSIDHGENLFKVSTYHLTDHYKERILDAINDYGPIGAFAYPSAVYILAQWCIKLGRTLPFIHLHTSSETILARQKDVIESCLKGNWLDHYGQAERVNCFVAFNNGSYRDVTEYGVTELLPQKNGRYEIVGSTLHNYAMPLFRYRTGDAVNGRTEDGDNRPIISGLSGRIEDFIVLPDRSMVGRLDLIFKGLSNIQEGQIYQPELKKIIIRVVPGKLFSQKDENQLLSNARKRLGNDIEITCNYVESIKRTKMGKFKFVISDVSST